MISKGADGYYHPANEQEIAELIQHANASKLKVRVRGSGHSTPAAIFTGNFESPPISDPNINIYLDRMIAVTFDDAKMQVTAQAGCHLGKDPADPTGTSTLENSLFYQLDQKGWAVPDMGGIIHQTVGGFLSTGSSGGSVKFSFSKAVVAITMVDGLGSIHHFENDEDPDNPFNAAAVSLGLLGIITRVTFQCKPHYNIRGTEEIYTYDDCPVDLFGTKSAAGKPSVEQYMRDTDHARMYWWPQKGVETMTIWEASVIPETPDFKPQPYNEFPEIFGTSIPSQFIASLLFRAFSSLNPPEPTGGLRFYWNRLLAPLFPHAVRLFLNSEMTRPQKFQDTWWHGLPMDNRVDYNLLPVKFTELWIPIEKSTEVLNVMRDYYAGGGFERSGTTTVEIYVTEASSYWLSPSYQQDVVKIDIFWFGYNRGDPAKVFYPQFWELLKPFEYRPHWGKDLPTDPDYLRQRYPRWDDFMALRQQMDPNQIFVSDYWRTHLGIPAAQ